MARRRRRVALCAALLGRPAGALAPRLDGAPVKLDRIAELRQLRDRIDAELAMLASSGAEHAEATYTPALGSRVDTTLETIQLKAPKEQIRAMYNAFNARDGQAVADLLADDVVYEDLLLGEATICRGKRAFTQALEFHPAFVSKKLNLPLDLKLVVDKVACDGMHSVGVEWHVEVDGKPFPLSRGLSLATTNAEGKLERVVDIAEAPWRVVGLLIRPLLTAVGATAAALGIGGLGYLTAGTTGGGAVVAATAVAAAANAIANVEQAEPERIIDVAADLAAVAASLGVS